MLRTDRAMNNFTTQRFTSFTIKESTNKVFVHSHGPRDELNEARLHVGKYNLMI